MQHLKAGRNTQQMSEKDIGLIVIITFSLSIFNLISIYSTHYTPMQKMLQVPNTLKNRQIFDFLVC